MNEARVDVALPDEAHTCALAALVADFVRGGAEIDLVGPLGAGKTAFARGLLAALGHRGKVKSPTFTLVESYELSRDGAPLTVHHFDLYRLEDEEELDYVGFDDYRRADTLLLVEWPSRAPRCLAPDLIVELAITGVESRAATLRLLGPDLRARATEFAVRAKGIKEIARKLP